MSRNTPNWTHYLKATVTRYLNKADSSAPDEELDRSLSQYDLLYDLFQKGRRTHRLHIDKKNALFRSLVFSPILTETNLITEDAVSMASGALFQILNTHSQVNEPACDALTAWISEYLEVPAHWCEPTWKKALACFNFYSGNTCVYTKLQAACTVGCGISVLLQLLDMYDTPQFEWWVQQVLSISTLGEVVLQRYREDAVMGKFEKRIKGAIYMLASGQAYLGWIQPDHRQPNRIDHLALTLERYNGGAWKRPEHTTPVLHLAHFLLMLFALYDVSLRVWHRADQLRLALFIALTAATLPANHMLLVGPEATQSAGTLSEYAGDHAFLPALMEGKSPDDRAATLFAATDVAFLLVTSTLAAAHRFRIVPQSAVGAWRYALLCPDPARVISALRTDMAPKSEAWPALFPAVEKQIKDRDLWTKVQGLLRLLEPSIRVAERTLCDGERRDSDVLLWGASQGPGLDYAPFIHRFEAKLARWLKKRVGAEHYSRDFVTQFQLFDGVETGEAQYARNASHNASRFDDWTHVDRKDSPIVNIPATREQERARYTLHGAAALWPERPPNNDLVTGVSGFAKHAYNEMSPTLDETQGFLHALTSDPFNAHKTVRLQAKRWGLSMLRTMHNDVTADDDTESPFSKPIHNASDAPEPPVSEPIHNASGAAPEPPPSEPAHNASSANAAYQGPLRPPRHRAVLIRHPPLVNYSLRAAIDKIQPEVTLPESPTLAPAHIVRAARNRNRQSYNDTSTDDLPPGDDFDEAYEAPRGHGVITPPRKFHDAGPLLPYGAMAALSLPAAMRRLQLGGSPFR